MKHILLLVSMAALVLTSPVSAQTVHLEFDLSLPSPVPDHHIDKVSVVAPLGIKTMLARMFVVPEEGPLHQVQPGGVPTVFPDILSPLDAARDSHFLFDTSNANVLFEFEDEFDVIVGVEFFAPFPSSFELGQIVGLDTHSTFLTNLTGTLEDDTFFEVGGGVIPEPPGLLLLTIAVTILLQRREGVRS